MAGFENTVDKVVANIATTLKAKNKDYGDAFRECRERYPMYTASKLYEKLKRIETLSNNDANVKTESLEDAYLDLAGYAILELVWRDIYRDFVRAENTGNIISGYVKGMHDDDL